MTSVTIKRLEKTRAMAETFERFQESGLTAAEFCKREDIHSSKFYYWWERFRRSGANGLIDLRQGVPHKVTDDVREYIRKVKMKDPLRSGTDIARMIKNRYGKTLTAVHVQRTLRDMGLNDPVGRKAGKPVKKTRK